MAFNVEKIWPRKRTPFQTIVISTLFLTLLSNSLNCFLMILKIKHPDKLLSSNSDLSENPISKMIIENMKLPLSIMLILCIYYIFIDLFGLIFSLKANKKLSLIFIYINSVSLLLNIILVVIYDMYPVFDINKYLDQTKSAELISTEDIKLFEVTMN